MKHKTIMRASNLSLFAVASIFVLGGCATYDEVESESVTSALDFDESNEFSVNVQNTSMIDTAFSEELRDYATEELIDALELHGFDYVGERGPDIRMTFSTYVVDNSGYVDTSLPVANRIVRQEVIRQPANRPGDPTIITTKTVEPIYVPSRSRLFILDVADTKTNVHLWRAYTIKDTTGLDAEDVTEAISLLVERLDEET